MFKTIREFTISVIFIFFFNQTTFADTPVIVIAPSKKPQSISTVGSSVVVFDENDIENSNEYFLQDILNFSSPGLNFNQNGGHGTFSGIQLRGLPKRYSTVYIDGIKMSDPSTISNDYYFDDILKNQISRVEILRGNQSTLYGSGAMGGTINITTKRGKPGFQKSLSYNTASHQTHNLAFSMSGADENDDFYIGIERFETGGISAMSDNNEEDGYKNGTLVSNYGRKIFNNLKFEINYRLADSFLNYDSGDSSTSNNNSDNNIGHTTESSSNLGFIYKPNDLFTNQLKFANLYTKRSYDEHDIWSNNLEEDQYRGYRNAIYYTGTYNIDLDTSLTFGAEREFDEMDYEPFGKDYNRDSNVTSQFFDLQKRFTNNIYVTGGLRFDEHSRSGTEDSHRMSLAYLFDDKLTKLKTSYGTSFRFPSLYEQYTAWKDGDPTLAAEEGESFDIGIEKNFLDRGIKVDLIYFNHIYRDTIDGFKDGSGDFNSYTHNQAADVTSEGLELISSWKKDDNLNFDLNYTFSHTYDGGDWGDTLDGFTGGGKFLSSRMVRVPKHIINLETNYVFPKNKDLSLTLQTKWSDTTRDYGNFNSPKSGTDYMDVFLDDYIVNNLTLNYNFFGYKTFLKIGNIFNEKYNTVLDYSQMDRTFNFGIRRSY